MQHPSQSNSEDSLLKIIFSYTDEERNLVDEYLEDDISPIIGVSRYSEKSS